MVTYGVLTRTFTKGFRVVSFFLIIKKYTKSY